MAEDLPSISGPLASGLRDVALELIGPKAIERALDSLPGDVRDHYCTFTAVEWVPIETMEAVFGAIAKETGTNVASLHERVASVSIERTMRTLWRVLLRLTTDAALVSRTPSVFARSYNRGRLVAEVPRSGRGEITLVEWPNVPAWTLRATRIGVATVLGLAGRRDIRVETTPTSTGARYLATWR
jgi:hypothetical protein